MRAQQDVMDRIRSAAMRMLTLDDTRWETMNSFREGYLEARALGDEESMDELVSYAVEMSQRAEGLADAAGLSPATVQAIESRKVKPQYRTVKKLARAFGCSVADLLGESERGHGVGRDTVA